MRRYFDYLKSLFLHKLYVFKAGRYVGVSLWQLLVHDLSKLSPTEFGAYVRYSATEEGRGSEAFAAAWLHHENANPHHWGHWIPRSGKYANQPLPMPERYVREMVADWMGAGRLYQGYWDIADWVNGFFERTADKLHPDTAYMLEYRVLEEIGVMRAAESRVWMTLSRYFDWSGERMTFHCPDCGCELFDTDTKVGYGEESSYGIVYHCPCGSAISDPGGFEERINGKYPITYDTAYRLKLAKEKVG